MDKEWAQEVAEYVRQYTLQQPVASLLIAGAIGYSLAYLIHRP